MPNETINVEAICPYFISRRHEYISCEGLIPGTRSQVKFPTAREMELWMGKACCTYQYARRCPVASMLEHMYDDD